MGQHTVFLARDVDQLAQEQIAEHERRGDSHQNDAEHRIGNRGRLVLSEATGRCARRRRAALVHRHDSFGYKQS